MSCAKMDVIAEAESPGRSKMAYNVHTFLLVFAKGLDLDDSTSMYGRVAGTSRVRSTSYMYT